MESKFSINMRPKVLCPISKHKKLEAEQTRKSKQTWLIALRYWPRSKSNSTNSPNLSHQSCIGLGHLIDSFGPHQRPIAVWPVFQPPAAASDSFAPPFLSLRRVLQSMIRHRRYGVWWKVCSSHSTLSFGAHFWFKFCRCLSREFDIAQICWLI